MPSYAFSQVVPASHEKPNPFLPLHQSQREEMNNLGLLITVDHFPFEIA